MPTAVLTGRHTADTAIAAFFRQLVDWFETSSTRHVVVVLDEPFYVDRRLGHRCRFYGSAHSGDLFLHGVVQSGHLAISNCVMIEGAG